MLSRLAASEYSQKSFYATKTHDRQDSTFLHGGGGRGENKTAFLALYNSEIIYLHAENKIIIFFKCAL